MTARVLPLAALTVAVLACAVVAGVASLMDEVRGTAR